MLIADAAEVVEVAAAAAVPRALQRSQSNQKKRVLCLKEKMGCKIRGRVDLGRTESSSSSSSCFSRWGEVYWLFRVHLLSFKTPKPLNFFDNQNSKSSSRVMLSIIMTPSR